MLIPAKMPIEAWHNAGYSEEWQFVDETDASVDLTGYSVSAQVRMYGAQPGAPTINLTGITISDALLGCIALTIDEATMTSAYAAHSASVAPGDPVHLVWDLHVTPTGGAPTEIWLQGEFKINAGVTA
jgi:hypothetical protein